MELFDIKAGQFRKSENQSGSWVNLSNLFLWWLKFSLHKFFIANLAWVFDLQFVLSRLDHT